jgi:hypothetical protein
MNDEMFQIQKLENSEGDYNTLVTSYGSSLVICTSRGNLHSYELVQADEPLKHLASYFMKDDDGIIQSQVLNRKVTVIPENQCKEVSAIRHIGN